MTKARWAVTTAAVILASSSLVAGSPWLVSRGDPAVAKKTGTAGSGNKVAPGMSTKLAGAFGDLPVHFEANRGQAGPEVGFLARSKGMSVQLSATAARIDVQGPQGPASVRMSVVGASPLARQLGQSPLQTTVNYHVGDDPDSWQSDIPTFAKVRTTAVYPGVDLVWRGRRGGEVEYDFVVSAGADPDKIRIAFEGASGLRLERGELVVAVRGGELRQRAPYLYQRGSDGRRRQVTGSFVLHGHEVGFSVGAYDRRRALVIDPVLAYSSYLGGARNDRVGSVAVDTNGNAFLAGFSQSSGFPTGWRPVFGTAPPARVGAAMAYHPASSKAVLFGGRGADGRLLADTWLFDGAAWSPLAIPAPPPRAYAGLALEPPAGRLVLFGGEGETASGAAKSLGDTWLFDGSAWVEVPAVAASPPARSKAAMASSHGTASPGAPGVLLFGGRSANGSLIGDTWLWNGANWSPQAVTTGPADRMHAAAATDSAGVVHIFGGVGEGGQLGDFWAWTGGRWEQQPGAPPARRGASLVRDDSGALRLVGGRSGSALLADSWIYRSGHTTPWVKEKVPPLPTARVGAAATRHDGAGVGVVAGGEGPKAVLLADTWSLDATVTTGGYFVAKLNSTGTALVYFTHLGGPPGAGNDDTPAIKVEVDAAGVAYVAGQARSTVFPTTPGSFQPDCKLSSSGACSDVFLTVLGTKGRIRYSTFLGGSGRDDPPAMALGPSGSVYVAGMTSSVDFPTTVGSFQPACASGCGGEGYLAKLSPVGGGSDDLKYSTYIRGVSKVLDIALGTDGVVYITGETRGGLPTTPGAFQPNCALNLQTGSCTDAYVVKLAPEGGSESDLRYATYIGGGCCHTSVTGAPGGAVDTGLGIAMGPQGSIYVTGASGSSDFPVTPGAFDSSFSCFSDLGCIGFFAKLLPAGQGRSDMIYATYLGGGSADWLSYVAVDASGRAVVGGRTMSASFPVRKAVQKTCGCNSGFPLFDAVVTKLDPSVLGDGSGEVSPTNQAVVFSTFLGGALEDRSDDVALDRYGNIYIIGSTKSTNFPLSPGPFQPAQGGGTWDGFFAKITGVP